MKRKTKNIILSTTAVGLACSLTAGALLNSGVSVAASAAMMPGIESIVNSTTAEKPLRILEIVDNKGDAEIGYYISGQEPYLKLYEYEGRTFSSVEEALAVIPEEERKNLMGDRGFAFGGEDPETHPLAYTPYEEKYFVTKEDSSWKRVDFKDEKPRVVELNGRYEKLNPGEGDYVKEEVEYYPVRGNIASDQEKAKYVQNIQGFAYTGENGANSPYLVNFSPVINTDGLSPVVIFTEEQVRDAYNYRNGRYGYYENVYRELTTKVDFNLFPGEKMPVETPEITQQEAESAFDDGVGFTGFSDFGSGEAFSDQASLDVPVDAAFAATDESPMIYRAQKIPEYPNYRYMEYMTLDAVKNTAEEYSEDLIKNMEAGSERITFDNKGVYLLWTKDELGPHWEYLYYVQGRQPVSIRNVRNLPLDYYGDEGFGDTEAVMKVAPYYYEVSSTAFSCVFDNSEDTEATPNNAELYPKAYRYTGWYYAFSPENEDVYLEVENNATYYTSEEEYTLKPGQGDYIFVTDENEDKVKVQVDHLYYKGGYTNHDWMKRYVFHLNPEEVEFEKFGIEVTTLTVAEFGEKYAAQAVVAAGFSDAGDSAEFVDAELSDQSAAFSADEEAVVPEETLPEEDIFEENVSEENAELESLPEDEISGELSPVEMIVSESLEEVETGELFLDSAEAEEIPEMTVEEERFSDTDEIPFVEDEFTSDAEAAFASEPVPEDPELADFDLIYINGEISVTDSAAMLAKAGIPCIINYEKMNENLSIQFASYVRESDADHHYVNQHIYVFHNSLWTEETGGDASDFINCQFHTNFNTVSEEEIVGNNPMEGFEEILEYIESENQYRELGHKDGISDGSDIPEEYLLSKEISQARAVEYILNYKHRRTPELKKEINILEIQPAKSDGHISENDILRWLGYDPVEATVTACCEEKIGESGGKLGHAYQMTDGDNATYWHSAYNAGNESYHKGTSPHWIRIAYNRPITFAGIHYTSRPGGGNGDITKFKISCYGESGLIDAAESGWSSVEGQDKVYTAENPVPGVNRIDLEVLEAYDNGNRTTNFASCAELKVAIANEESLDYPKVTITTMTSSEYVGHIEDINTEYDMIYWGTDETNLGLDVNFRPENYLYYHIGAAVTAKGELQGLMSQDYTIDGNGNLAASVIQGEVGQVRGSGNDITLQQTRELLNFVKSGYPVILGDALLTQDRKIAEDRVDNSSYIWQFLSEALNYSNVMTVTEALKNQNLAFYMNIPKPKIVFNEKPVSAIGDESGTSKQYMSEDAEGLRYEFEIKNDAAVSSVNSWYNCELYLDLNCDGNFSPKQERIGDIQVRENGSLLSRNEAGEYELQTGKTYTLTRVIPKEYVKLIAWKLEISNNQNSNIRTSETGYTKRSGSAGESVPEIRVLQIHPEGEGKVVNQVDSSGNSWDLTSPDFTQYFNVVADEFRIDVQEISVPEYNNGYDLETGNLGKEGLSYKNLNDYDMLIIGFGDGGAYGTVNEAGTEGIKKFIQTGKSVIFAHDTTSSYVLTPGTTDPNNINIWRGGWAYNFNMQLRPVMGMDRYGITGNTRSDMEKSEQISGILKQAAELQASDESESIWNLVRSNVPDMAYKLGTGQRETVAQTHGFSNERLRTAKKDNPKGISKVTRVTNVNEGAITEYPYKIPDENGFTVARTHSQYYQAALEADSDQDGRNDLVVWYCLDDGNYADSPNDVRNNYYIYSNKNVFYTGVGHFPVDHEGNDNENEKKLFVNTIVAAYRASAVNPLIEYVSDFDIDAPEQEIVYYMTDQKAFAQEAGNLLNESQELYFRVKDNNLISTGVEEAGERKMNVEFYITPPSGASSYFSVEGIDEEVVKLENINIYQENGSQTQTVSSGNVYRFRLDNMYQYLMDEYQNYRNDVKLYIKVTTTYNYFGQIIKPYAVDSLSLRQRQLFDMD